MTWTPAAFADLQKHQMDALNAVAGTLVNATEQLTNLNFAAARALLQEVSQIAENLVRSQDAQGALAIVGDLVQPTADKLASYSRNLYGIACGANAELSRIVDSQVAEGSETISELIDFAFKNAPAGSEAAASFLRSSVLASTTAYNAVASAAKQATELTESNMATAKTVANEPVRSKACKTP